MEDQLANVCRPSLTQHTDGVVELVVIVGPIASGKSTVAQALGERFRACRRPVAVLDLDEVVETIGGYTDLSGARFHGAMFVFGELVAAWLAQGFRRHRSRPVLSTS